MIKNKGILIINSPISFYFSDVPPGLNTIPVIKKKQDQNDVK